MEDDRPLGRVRESGWGSPWPGCGRRSLFPSAPRRPLLIHGASGPWGTLLTPAAECSTWCASRGSWPFSTRFSPTGVDIHQGDSRTAAHRGATPLTCRLSRRPRGNRRLGVALGGACHAALPARASWLPHAFCLGVYRVSGAGGGGVREERGGGGGLRPGAASAWLLEDPLARVLLRRHRALPYRGRPPQHTPESEPKERGEQGFMDAPPAHPRRAPGDAAAYQAAQSGAPLPSVTCPGRSAAPPPVGWLRQRGYCPMSA
jgi:hypothetical protein